MQIVIIYLFYLQTLQNLRTINSNFTNTLFQSAS